MRFSKSDIRAALVVGLVLEAVVLVAASVFDLAAGVIAFMSAGCYVLGVTLGLAIRENPQPTSPDTSVDREGEDG